MGVGAPYLSFPRLRLGELMFFFSRFFLWSYPRELIARPKGKYNLGRTIVPGLDRSK
jgi:hypothetical protein